MSDPNIPRHSPGNFRVQRTGPPMGARGPMIVKRDGQVEPFNRVKMIESMRHAGATPQQASLVTNRVVTRLQPGPPIPSRQVSTMVARSLSHVNPTASRNYADTRDQKLAYNERANRLSAQIAAINQQVNSATLRIGNLDSKIQGLPSRISQIRKSNFRVMTHLETDQATLYDEWLGLSPELRNTANLKGEVVRNQVRDLQQVLTNKLRLPDYNVSSLQEIESAIPQLRSNLSEMQSSIVNAMSPLEQKFESINQEVEQAENTLSLLQGASFPWEEGETPILSIRAKDLDSDFEGVITLTNLNFVFEQEKEVVLKKTLFVVTEKKTVREVKVQKPIGMIASLIHGKVGFFKGSGLFVKFAPESGIREMKFDTSSEDADWITKSYNYVNSGQAETELAAAAPPATKEQVTPQLVICKVCGAPYTEKVFRGQTSVNCKYCGAVVSIK